MSGNTVTAVTALDGTSNTMIITLGTALSSTDTPDVTYTKGDIKDTSGNAMDTATVTPTDGLKPNVISARISTNTITIIYDKAVNTVLGDYSDLTTSVPSTPTLSSISGSGTDTIVITIFPDVPTGATATIDISTGVTSVATGAALTAINDQPITAEDVVALAGNDTRIVVNEADSILTTITYPRTVNATLDYGGILAGDSFTTNNEITVTNTGPGPAGGDVEIRFAAGTTFTGPPGFTGVIVLPEDKLGSGCVINHAHGTLVSCINIGQSGVDISADKPVRIKFSGQAGNTPWLGLSGVTTEITTSCTADTLAAATAQIIQGPPNECFINSGSDLVIWTNHFTQFGSSVPSSSHGGSGDGCRGDCLSPSFLGGKDIS